MKRARGSKAYIRPALIGAIIFAIVFSHFAVSQFIFFESEIDSVLTESIDKQAAGIRTEYEAKISPAAAAPEKKVALQPGSEAETDRRAPRQTAKQPSVRKKETPRQSRAERLRRAEKLLTGV